MSYKVVFHIDESEKWDLLLKNVTNLQGHMDFAAAQVEVLANAFAVREYSRQLSTNLQASMAELAAAGVRFAACHHALDALEIPQSALLPFVRIVPAGVLELMDRQAEGYAYIKP